MFIGLGIFRILFKPGQGAIVVQEKDPLLVFFISINNLMQAGGIDFFRKGKLLDLFHSLQAFDKLTGPSSHRIAMQAHHHHLVSPDLLLLRHLNGLPDGFGNGIKVVWIHQQRFVQLLGSTCKFTQNQHPGSIMPGSYKFFRYQVHPVPEGEDQGDI